MNTLAREWERASKQASKVRQSLPVKLFRRKPSIIGAERRWMARRDDRPASRPDEQTDGWTGRRVLRRLRAAKASGRRGPLCGQGNNVE